MSNVVAFQPYHIVGRLEARTDRLTAHLLTAGEVDREMCLHHVRAIAGLIETMKHSLDQVQRKRLEDQLEASVGLMNPRFPKDKPILEVSADGVTRARRYSEFDEGVENSNAG